MAEASTHEFVREQFFLAAVAQTLTWPFDPKTSGFSDQPKDDGTWIMWSESFRSVHVGRSRFSRCCHLIGDLSFQLKVERGPGD
jgi:hypothetical protein